MSSYISIKLYYFAILFTYGQFTLCWKQIHWRDSLTFWAHGFTPGFNLVRFAQSLLFCIMFLMWIIVCPFSVGHCIVYPTSAKVFWLPRLVSSDYFCTSIYFSPAWFLYHNSVTINVREYRRCNQKWTIQRNSQYIVHKTTKNKNPTS